MRERLSRHYQETLTFQARFLNYSKTPEGSNVVCLGDIHLGHLWMADHVWIHRSKTIKQLELKRGDMVEFEARVNRYCKEFINPETGQRDWDYGLEKVKEFKVIERKE
jgi:hypothetical protein